MIRIKLLVLVSLAAAGLVLPGCRPRARFVAAGRNQDGCDEVLWLADSAVMVRVPAGAFLQGSDSDSADARPAHEVTLGEYYIDKHEVTNRQYRRFCDATRHPYPNIEELGALENYTADYPDYPVVAVSSDDARAYCRWVGKRLPTEAEWKRAARGTDGRRYPWGNAEPDSGGIYRANWGEGRDRTAWELDGFQYASPVGSFPAGASATGCLDMAGNVWEWCDDWYEPGYRTGAADSDTGWTRVIRGGSWSSGRWWLRCASRSSSMPARRDHHRLGFRCAWSARPPDR